LKSTVSFFRLYYNSYQHRCQFFDTPGNVLGIDGFLTDGEQKECEKKELPEYLSGGR